MGQEPNTTTRKHGPLYIIQSSLTSIIYVQYTTLLPASPENDKYKDYLPNLSLRFFLLKATIYMLRLTGFSGEISYNSFTLGYMCTYSMGNQRE